MPRPLIQHGVGQLEEMFAKGKTDPKGLNQLENELQHRQIPRAIALLTEVQATLHGSVPAAPPAAAPTTMPLFPPVPQPEPVPKPLNPPPAQSPAIVQSRRPSVTLVPQKPPAPPAVSMPLDEAYKLLKAAPASIWESIEQTRRLLVQQAHPSRIASLGAEKRAQARVEAARCNAAYLRLSAARCSN